MKQLNLAQYRNGFRRFLVYALIAPLFVTISAPLPQAEAVVSSVTAPQDMVATANGTSLNLAWGVPTSGASLVTGYQVDYSTDGSNWTTASATISAGASTYAITGLTSGTSYYTRVAAKLASGTGPWAYPWVKLYGTVTPKRDATNNIVYEPGYGLAAYKNQAANVYATSTFSRVRYEMQYLSNDGRTFNYVNTDFAKWNQTNGNKYDGGTTYNSPAATISTLEFPDNSNSQLPIQAAANDLTIESSDKSLNNHSVTGRLQIWSNNIGQANGWSGGADGSASAFDYNDAPGTALNGFGSFQVHDITNARTVFAWNRQSNTLPDIGIGNSPTCGQTGNISWVYCGQTTGSTYYNTTNRDAWKLETFINVPTKMGTSGLLTRLDSKRYSSYSGSGSTWSDVSGNGVNATLYNSLTTSSVSNGSFNINAMTFNGSNQYATLNGDFGYDFSGGFSTSFYANFGNISNNSERIFDFGNADANRNILVARSGTSNDLFVQLYNSGPAGASTGSCKAVGAIDNNTWTHWAIVLNGSTCSIFKNGAYWSGTTTTVVGATTTNGTGSPVAFTPLPSTNARTNLYLGRSNWSSDSYFEGGIADIAIYNKPLSRGDVFAMVDDQKATTVYSNNATGECATRVANPTGVTVTTVGSDCLIKFSAPSNTTTSNKWFTPSNVSAARVLTIAGGGAGGAHVGAGGGAGGMIDTTTSISPSSAISITTGAGGTNSGTDTTVGAYRIGSGTSYFGKPGANSTFGSLLIALGGGAGASWDVVAVRTGGSGGGGTASGGSGGTTIGTTLDPTQGNNGGNDADSCGSSYGYPTGGGGGAGGPGQNGYCSTYSAGKSGDGGIGRISDITGSEIYYAGGGGGAGHNDGSYAIFQGNGGLGGGGTAGLWKNGIRSPGTCANETVRGVQGTDGLGGGGGAAGIPSAATCNNYAGRGGSGVVYVRYGNTTLSINVNGGSSFTGTTSFSGSTYSYITLPAQSGISRTGYTFTGWNTAATGNGKNYPAGSTFQLLGNQTLYAQWNSVISYNPNGPTIDRVVEPTTATGSGASTTLNNGSALTTGIVTNGLDLFLDAGNTRSYSGSGTTWFDLSGNGRNATAVGSPTFSSADGAFNFNGTSQYFNLGTANFNYQGTQPYTLASWFKTSSPSKAEQCLICRYNDTAAPGSFLLRLISGNPESYRAGQNTYQYTGLTVNSSTYYYVATSYDGTNINIFVNGIRVYSAASGSMSFSAGVNTLIGASPATSRLFQGQIKVVQAYNVALNDAQILQNYKALLNDSYEAELPTTPGSKSGSTLTGWAPSTDTASAVSSGTYATGLVGLPTPHIRLKATDYNGTSWNPTNYSGAGISNWTSTAPVLKTNQTGWGTSASFSTVSGTSGNAIRLGNRELPVYTFCAMAKFPVNGVTAPSTGRIFTGTNVNWLDGWYYGRVGSTHHTAWNVDPAGVDYNWHYYCDSGNDIYLDGKKLISTYQSYTTLPTLSIGGGYWNGSGWVDFSDFEFTEIVIYDQVLSNDQLDNVHRYFKNTYGFENTSAGSPSASLVPSGTYASTGSSTLYAAWGATVTYDANKASTGTAPATQVFTRGSGTLATNTGNLTQKGKSFYGWNTAADGSGTFYAPGASYSGADVTLYAVYRVPVQIQGTSTNGDPVTLNPYMRFKASDYNAAQKIWYDSSGNSRDTSYVRGAPTLVTSPANSNGSKKSFTTLQGGSGDGIQFKNPTMTSGNWTIFSVARYNGTQPSTLARIFDGEAGNFLFGFYNRNSGVAHYNGWVTSTADSFGQNWLVSTGYTDNYRGLGIKSSDGKYGTYRATANVTDTLQQLTINAGELSGSEQSAWQVAEVLIFDYQLSSAQIQQVEDYLATNYGITDYAPQNTYTDSRTALTVVGASVVTETVTATLGLNNVFTVSPTIPGISLNKSGNTASLTIANTLAVGTYYETITATDANGNTAFMPFIVSVVPPLLWSSSNPTILQTTYGKSGQLRLDLAGGAGTRRASITHMSTPSSSAITIDSTTAASGYITLKVDTGTPIGTYVESITVIDATNVTRTIVITVTVSASPLIAYPNANNVPDIVQSGLLVRYELDKSTSYSGTGNTITDLQGRSNASITGSPAFSREFNGHLVLTGTQYVQMKTGLTSSQMGDTVSAFMWVYPTDNGIILDERGQVNADGTYKDGWNATNIEVTGGTAFKFRVWNMTAANAVTYTDAGGVLNKAWYYIGYTYNKATLTFTAYVNGNPVGTYSLDRVSPIESAGYYEFYNLGGPDVTYISANTQGNFKFGAFHLYSTSLTANEVLNNYLVSKGRFTYLPSSGTLALSTTAGIDKTFSVFTGILGVGTKAFTGNVTPTNAGIVLTSTDTNTASVSVTSSVAAATYVDTLTVTDSNGMSSFYPVTITVNPRIAITATVDTITTSFGRVAYDTLTTTSGTGTGNITFTRVSSSGSSVITHTTTSGSPATAVLAIGANLPAGTYYETFTATDAVGATTIKVIQIVVNPSVTLTGPLNNRVETTGTKATTANISVAFGTGNRSAVLSPNIAGITLTTTNINTGTIVLNLSSAVAVGAYYETITVTDAVGGISNLVLLVVVNALPTITYAGATTGALSFVTTAGGSLTTSAFTAALGTSPRRFSISGLNTGISLDTTTADFANLTFGPALTSTNTTTPKTYSETLTVTDSMSATSFRTISVIVNPAIIETATTTTITTTSGIESSTVVYASQGTGNKIFTRTGVQNSGITLTQGTNQATLKVLSTINPGTYYETITASDTSGATTSLGIKLIVNPAPVISGSAAAAMTTGYAFTSPIYSASNGTGALTIAYSGSLATGFSIETLTASTFRFKVTSAVLAGTYYETFTATDALGAIARYAITLTVNPVLALSGSLAINTTFGSSKTTVYQTSGGTGPFSILGSTICAPVQTTSGAYTVLKFVGLGTCTWTVPEGVSNVEALVVAGGGSGGSRHAGGGGAGGYVSQTSVAVTPGSGATVTVGAGGNAVVTPGGGTQGNSGANSVFGSLTAIGGGGGGQTGTNGIGSAGGSGGGSTYEATTGGAATAGQGSAGGTGSWGDNEANWAGGGGGGAGGAGSNASNTGKVSGFNNKYTGNASAGAGGAGTANSITGSSICYAAGGGGSISDVSSGIAGTGGMCAGVTTGGAGTRGAGTATQGTDETGSGGGAAGFNGNSNGTSGRGGNGAVVLKFLTPASSTLNAVQVTTDSYVSTGVIVVKIPESVTVGTYTENLTVTQASGFGATNTYTVTITVAKATPTAQITLPGSVTTATYGTPVTLSASASTAGAVTFKKAGVAISSACTSVATSNGVATCSWTPSAVETASITTLLVPTDLTNYNNSSETASALSVVVGTADTFTVTAASRTTTYTVDGSAVANTTFTAPSSIVTGLLFNDTVTALSYTYSGTLNDGTTYASSATAPKQAGNYSITPLVTASVGTSNYKGISYISSTLTINRGLRTGWTITYNFGTNATTYAPGKIETVTVTTPGDGARSFSTSSTVCSVNSSTGAMTLLGVGACEIQVVLAQTANWVSDTKTVTVTINRGIRVATLTSASAALKYGETTTTTSSVTLAIDNAPITYSIGNSTGCSIDPASGTITATKGTGTCGVSVNYAQTTLYESATSTSLAITISKANAPIVTMDSVTALTYTGAPALFNLAYKVSGILPRDILQIIPTADASTPEAIAAISVSSYTSISSYRFTGSGSGWSYAETSTVPTDGGTYSVVASGLGLLSGLDINNYNSPTYNSTNAVILPIAQKVLNIEFAFQESVTVPYDMTITGGSSSAPLVLTVQSGGSATGCTIVGLRLTTTSAGTCLVIASKAADRNYLEVASDLETITVLNFVVGFFGNGAITINHDVPIIIPTACSVNCVPTITSVSNPSIPGGTEITRGLTIIINGTNFNTVSEVVFQRRNRVDSSGITINNDTQITVLVPADMRTTPLPIQIYVVASGGESAPDTTFTLVTP